MNYFDFVRSHNPADLLKVLEKESSHTIFVVLSCLEPGKAAVLLQNLPQERFREIAVLISRGEHLPDSVIKAISEDIQKKLLEYEEKQEIFASSVALGGAARMAEIINLMDRKDGEQLLEYFEKNNTEIYTRVNRYMLGIEDLVKFDDRAVQKIIYNVDAKDLAGALTNASDELKEKIIKNMSKNAAKYLKENLELTGSIKEKDVDEYRKKIIAKIKRLEDCGELVIPY